MVSEKTSTTAFEVGIRRIIASILALSLIFVLFGIFNIGIMPVKFLAAAMLYAAISLVIIWLLIWKKSANKPTLTVALCILAVIFSGLNIYGTYSTRALDNLLSTVQRGNQASYVEYAIVALKNSGVSLENATTISVITSDPLYLKVSKLVENEMSAGQVIQGSLAAVKNSLVDRQAQTAVIRKALLPIVQEADKAFYDNLVILKTLSIEGDDNDAKAVLDATKPFILYISGIDTDGNISAVSRSDVNMLMVINPLKQSMLLVNTPRDYYVQLHDTTGLRDKLTHAGVYGVDMSMRTLEDLYGVVIQQYVRINFTSLTTLIDIIGPIDVYSDYAFGEFKQGMNTLDSKQALAFARERYSFREGDRQRGRNQQHIIEAIIAKLSRTENAVRLPQIIDKIRGSIETDMPEESLKTLIRNQLNDIRPWKIESISVDGTGAMLPTHSYGDTPLYVMMPSEESVRGAKAKLAEYLKQ